MTSVSSPTSSQAQLLLLQQQQLAAQNSLIADKRFSSVEMVAPKS